MIQLDFIVLGKVQNVFFRKYTLDEALRLNLRGFVKNADDLSVQGTAVGEFKNIEEFKHFLRYVGSPHSVIKDAIFQEKTISESDVTFTTFEILR